MEQQVKIGTKIKANTTIHYFMGQIASDKICKGEICTVDGIYDKGTRVTVKEHADRYGPWPLDCFEVVLKFKIKKIDVKVETEFDRDGEPKKAYDKIYIWTEGESIIENLLNRRNRPYDEYKKNVIPQLMEKLKETNPRAYKDLKNIKWGWNQNCGCSMCPCSPGFVGNVRKPYPNNLYEIHLTVKVTY